MYHHPGPMGVEPASFGVILGPFDRDQNPDELAKNIFRLLSCLGMNCVSISQVAVNPKEGYAKVGLFTKESEDYLMDVFNNVHMIMNMYDLRRLSQQPERLSAKRLEDVDLKHGKDRLKIQAKHCEQQGKSGVDVEKTKLKGEEPAVTEETKPTQPTTSTESEVSDLSEFELEKKTDSKLPPAAELSMSESVMTTRGDASNVYAGQVEATTSTPFSVPCGCPETIFYHQHQHIGTETRYAEFKKGNFIRNSQQDFRNTVGKYVCSFLNSEGGTLYFGVTDDGLVRGLEISKQLEEDLKQDIRFTMRQIEPSVPSSDYTINFARVIRLDTEKSAKVRDVKSAGPKETDERASKGHGKSYRTKGSNVCSDSSNSVSYDTDREKEANTKGQRSASSILKVLELCVKPRRPPKPGYMFMYGGLAFLRRDGSVERLHGN